MTIKATVSLSVIATASALSCGFVKAPPACAQTTSTGSGQAMAYPTKPIRLIVPYPPGAGKGLMSPDISQRFYVSGLEVATSTPQGYHDIIRNDLQAWRKLIKENQRRFAAVR